ncbi:hypothetical protein [Ammonifex thiophilus]|uniref:Uncharacterized protein n=1 Tax=Ammonifex thiophilus TaxID=444093 RepID=A0A3D8P7J9_9THEO|nr:hypothetical protein [Ammonifex thiophilus]RDV84852.1 hypothetical protein DXX99_02095 [Ammonifex thiophilus]
MKKGPVPSIFYIGITFLASVAAGLLIGLVVLPWWTSAVYQSPYWYDFLRIVAFRWQKLMYIFIGLYALIADRLSGRELPPSFGDSLKTVLDLFSHIGLSRCIVWTLGLALPTIFLSGFLGGIDMSVVIFFFFMVAIPFSSLTAFEIRLSRFYPHLAGDSMSSFFRLGLLVLFVIFLFAIVSHVFSGPVPSTDPTSVMRDDTIFGLVLSACFFYRATTAFRAVLNSPSSSKGEVLEQQETEKQKEAPPAE